jgi:SPX domain protein involved in polyphosphate accumulation
MRYGKKLALLTENAVYKGIHRPFISHRSLKGILASITRAVKYGAEDDSIPQMVEEFKETLASDLASILSFIRIEEMNVNSRMQRLEKRATLLGILNSKILDGIIDSIGSALLSPCIALHDAIGDYLKGVWVSLTVEISAFADQVNEFASAFQSLLTYADLNVAGFRKLIKQYRKQVPSRIFADIVSEDEYRLIVSGLVETHSRFDAMRTRVQNLMQKLSPGAPTLTSSKLGSETLRVLKPNSISHTGPSTASTSPCLHEIPEFSFSLTVEPVTFPPVKLLEP